MVDMPLMLIKKKLLDEIHQAVISGDFGTTPDTKSTITLSGSKVTDLVSILQTNSSKIVDENGEPMVMYHGERIAFRTSTYSKILRELQIEPNATLLYLQHEVGVSRSALQKMLKTLQEKGFVQKDDKGSWRVFITPSM